MSNMEACDGRMTWSLQSSQDEIPRGTLGGFVVQYLTDVLIVSRGISFFWSVNNSQPLL